MKRWSEAKKGRICDRNKAGSESAEGFKKRKENKTRREPMKTQWENMREGKSYTDDLGQKQDRNKEKQMDMGREIGECDTQTDA